MRRDAAGRGRWGTRLALVVSATATAVMVISGSALALDRTPYSEDLLEVADAIMSKDYDAFAELKESESRIPDFNWYSDGCSGPTYLKRFYADLFEVPCEMHDFGYRNYGDHSDGLRLDPDEDTRAWIDRRFHSEMTRLCGDVFGWYRPKENLACRAEAAAVYAAVRNAGQAEDSFYSRD